MTFRQVNLIPAMHLLGYQKLTPKSDANVAIEANRPINVPYHFSWPREGFLSLKQISQERHWEEVRNSRRNRDARC